MMEDKELEEAFEEIILISVLVIIYVMGL